MRIPDLREAADIKGSRQLSRKAVPPTYIPLKNAIFYSMAAAYAEEKGSRYIIGGHNGDDMRVFEDAGDGFFTSMQAALSAASPRLSKNKLEIMRPLRDMGKPEVVALGAALGVPFEYTWSCHRAGERHCWKCAGCKARTKAFKAAGIKDPLRPKKV